MSNNWEEGDFYEQDGAYIDEDHPISPDYSDFLYDQWKDEQVIAEYDLLKSGLEVKEE